MAYPLDFFFALLSNCRIIRSISQEELVINNIIRSSAAAKKDFCWERHEYHDLEAVNQTGEMLHVVLCFVECLR